MKRRGFLAALGVGVVCPGGGAGWAGTGRAEISQSLGSTPGPSMSSSFTGVGGSLGLHSRYSSVPGPSTSQESGS